MDLYTLDGCPFCHKVLRKVEELGIQDKIEIRRIEEKENEEKLLSLGGKVQVPFLVAGETMMYESDDIVEYLESIF